MTMIKSCSTIKRNVILSDYTSVKIGGVGKMVAYPTANEFSDTIIELVDNDLPFYILGRGSNTLISDDGYRGVVVMTTKLNSISVVGETMCCGAGASLIEASRLARENSLSGLEWAVGIPGSIGGALVTNAGAYGGSIGDIVDSVTIVKDKEKVYKNEDLGFTYRDSRVGDLGAVKDVVLKLKKSDYFAIVNREGEYVTRRRNSQPRALSLGSVYKAHNGISAGYYIDQAGLKGLRIGGAEVSHVHAGFIINLGGATSRDYHKIMEIVEQTVYDKYGIKLIREIKFLE